MNTPETIFWTIFVAVVTLVAGQLLTRFFVEPVLAIRREIAEVAYNLTFYWNRMFDEGDEATRIRELIRGHACALFRLSHVPIIYDSIFWMIGMPRRKRIHDAISDLIGLSNTVGSKTPEDPKHERRDSIYRNLKITKIGEIKF